MRNITNEGKFDTKRPGSGGDANMSFQNKLNNSLNGKHQQEYGTGYFGDGRK
jgi:hypothetical protein